MDHTEQELSKETETYAEAVLFPEFAEKYDPNYRPPVWAEVRSPCPNTPLTNTDSPATTSWKVLSTSASSNKLPIAGTDPFMVSLWTEIVEKDATSTPKLSSRECMSPLLCLSKSNVAVTGWLDHTQDLLGAPGH